MGISIEASAAPGFAAELRTGLPTDSIISPDPAVLAEAVTGTNYKTGIWLPKGVLQSYLQE